MFRLHQILNNRGGDLWATTGGRHPELCSGRGHATLPAMLSKVFPSGDGVSGPPLWGEISFLHSWKIVLLHSEAGDGQEELCVGNAGAAP